MTAGPPVRGRAISPFTRPRFTFDRLGYVALDQADRRRLPYGRDQGRHDGGAGAVAADVDDAALGMGGLARHGEVAGEVAVEGDAVVEEVVDAGGGVG